MPQKSKFFAPLALGFKGFKGFKPFVLFVVELIVGGA